MSFYVDPDAVDRMACLASAFGGDADVARNYNDRHTVPPTSAEGRCLNDFVASMDDVRSSVEQALWHLRTITVNTAAELFATADYYRATDTTTATALDGTLPPVPRVAEGPRAV